MSDVSNAQPTETAALPTEAAGQVVEAAEDVVRSAKVRATDSAKPAAKRRATSKEPTKDTVAVLAETVNTLANTVEQLAATVQAVAGRSEALSISSNAPARSTHVSADEPKPAKEHKRFWRSAVPVLVPVAAVELDPSAREVQPEHDASLEPTNLLAVVATYAKYVAMFVGAGLISGAVVHFPLAPTRYLVIGVIGAVLFTIASVFADFRSRKSSIAGVAIVVASSLFLALGIGMVGGGIQHFADFPSRAAKLIPLGFGISVVAFIFRRGYRLSQGHVVTLASGVVSVMMVLAIGLDVVSSQSTAAGDHAHEEEAVAGESEATAATADAAHEDAAHAESTSTTDEAHATDTHATEASTTAADTHETTAATTDAAHAESAGH